MKTIIAMLTAGMFLAPGPVFCAAETAGGNKEAQQQYVTGLKYFQAGNYEKAETEWRSASALDPQNPDVKQGLERLSQLKKKDQPAGAAAEAGQGDKPEAVLPYGLVKGYRGTTLPVSGDQALYLKEGDRVDVLVTFDAKTQDKGKEERKEKVTATILQNVAVLNVSRPEKVDDLGAVELLLNPVEAQYAALSIAQGSIHIVLRAVGDVELHPMEMASFRRLIQ